MLTCKIFDGPFSHTVLIYFHSSIFFFFKLTFFITLHFVLYYLGSELQKMNEHCCVSFSNTTAGSDGRFLITQLIC